MKIRRAVLQATDAETVASHSVASARAISLAHYRRAIAPGRNLPIANG